MADVELDTEVKNGLRNERLIRRGVGLEELLARHYRGGEVVRRV